MEHRQGDQTLRDKRRKNSPILTEKERDEVEREGLTEKMRWGE